MVDTVSVPRFASVGGEDAFFNYLNPSKRNLMAAAKDKKLLSQVEAVHSMREALDELEVKAYNEELGDRYR